MSITDNTMETKQQDAGTTTTNAGTDGVINPVASTTTTDDNKEGIKTNGSTTEIGVSQESAEKPTSKPPAASGTATTATSTGDVETNGNSKDASADVETKTEESGGASKDVDVDDDDDGQGSVKSEGADEEDALFTNLEEEVEKEEAAHPHEQPKDAKAAPKLLQSALVSGDIKMDDSEHGSAIAAAAAAAAASAAEAKAAEEEHHIHQRVSSIFYILWLCQSLIRYGCLWLCL
jgi:hypothetical protein